MSEDDVAAMSKMAGLEIDPAYLPGVARNLDVLLGQAALLASVPIEPLIEPATVFRP